MQIKNLNVTLIQQYKTGKCYYFIMFPFNFFLVVFIENVKKNDDKWPEIWLPMGRSNGYFLRIF